MRLPPSAVAWALAALVACTPAATPPTPPPAPTVTTTTVPTVGDAVAEFAQCMSVRGVEVPEPPLDAQGHADLAVAFAGSDTTAEGFRSALAACAPPLVDSGALSLEGDPELRSAVAAALSAFAACMRDQGLEFPDPDPAFDGRGSAFDPTRVPYGHPRFHEAAAACQEGLGPSE